MFPSGYNVYYLLWRQFPRQRFIIPRLSVCSLLFVAFFLSPFCFRQHFFIDTPGTGLKKLRNKTGEKISASGLEKKKNKTPHFRFSV